MFGRRIPNIGARIYVSRRARYRRGVDVLACLRLLLVQARHAGTPFEEAWPVACKQALARAYGPIERENWALCLRDTMNGWRDAYGGRDHPASRLAAAAEMLAAA